MLSRHLSASNGCWMTRGGSPLFCVSVGSLNIARTENSRLKMVDFRLEMQRESEVNGVK